jgi:hypothetical protein
MDFNQLMARMRELDQPAQAQVQEATPVGECGDPMMGQSSMGMNNQMPPPPAHPREAPCQALLGIFSPSRLQILQNLIMRPSTVQSEACEYI